jgi:hypothetical protein
MLGETTLGTWVAYGALVLLLVVMVVMVLRVLGWLSLLFISPIADILRKIPIVRQWIPASELDNRNSRTGRGRDA